MSDPIEKQAAIDEAEEWISAVYCERDEQRERDAIKHVIDGIKKLPSAQSERPKGKWITYTKGSVVTAYKCSECGRTVRDDTGYDVANDYPFCHCGADMRGEQDEND